MDNQIKTSFVPKKTLVQNPPAGSSIGLAAIVGFIILGVSLVLFAGVFAYNWFLADSINRPCNVDNGDQGCGLKESLAREERELDVDKVTRFANLDAKTKAAQGIVNNHISLLPLMAFLEDYTLHTIRFTDFEFSKDNEVKLSGQAKQYEDIAVQMKTFRNSGKVTSASFSNFNTEEDGNITFDLELSVDTSLFDYKIN